MKSRRRGVRKKWRSIVVSKIGYLWFGKLVNHNEDNYVEVGKSRCFRKATKEFG